MQTVFHELEDVVKDEISRLQDAPDIHTPPIGEFEPPAILVEYTGATLDAEDRGGDPRRAKSVGPYKVQQRVDVTLVTARNATREALGAMMELVWPIATSLSALRPREWRWKWIETGPHQKDATKLDSPRAITMTLAMEEIADG